MAQEQDKGSAQHEPEALVGKAIKRYQKKHGEVPA